MWQRIELLNNMNKDFVIIPGEELSAGNFQNQNVHYLIFNNRSFFDGCGDSAEKWFCTKPRHKVSDVLSKLKKEALSFAAHPILDPPFIQKLLIRRGIWTERDLKLPALHGMPTFGPILATRYRLALQEEEHRVYRLREP